MKKYDNKGFSMIEVIVVIAKAGYALISLSSLILGTNITKQPMKIYYWQVI